MAKYDRRILVPHLQDVCWVEMEYQEKMSVFSESLSNYENIRGKLVEADALKEPTAPREEDYVTSQVSLILTIAIAATAVFLFMLLSELLFDIGFLVIFLLVLPCLWFFVVKKSNDRSSELAVFHKKEEEHSRKMSEYYAAKESCKDMREQEAVCFRQHKEAKEQLELISSLREKLYSVNIIPNKYRNLHAAYYLYDYFCSSQEDDLDGIIKTMLLDDIVQQLDVIIQQQRQVILNQRRQIAIQESGNEQLAERHAEQMRAIATMEGNQLQQQKYLQMIDDRIRVNNYFTKGTYKQEKAWIESL